MGVKASPAIDTVAPEIMPIVIVGDLTGQPLGGQTRWAMGAANPAAGGAGTYAVVQLWNPASSGVELVLESYVMSHATAHSFNMYYDTAAASTLVNSRRYLDDDRWLDLYPPAYTPLGQIRTETPAVRPGTLIGIDRVGSASGIHRIGPSIRLKAGSGFNFAQQTANQSLAMTVIWREERVQ